MDLTVFKTDSDLETGGVWVDLDDVSKIKVARSDNKNFTNKLTKLMTPYKNAIRSNTLSEDIADKIMLKCMSETILVDWEGITEEGEPLEYTPDNAYRILKSYKDFRNLVSSISEDLTNYKISSDKDTEKN